jgi:hypothetical protein
MNGKRREARVDRCGEYIYYRHANVLLLVFVLLAAWMMDGWTVEWVL